MGVGGKASPKPKAINEPIIIPKVKKIEMNIPTDSFKSLGALEGDLIAHNVLAKPLVIENKNMLTILNQSALYPNSHEGGT